MRAVRCRRFKVDERGASSCPSLLPHPAVSLGSAGSQYSPPRRTRCATQSPAGTRSSAGASLAPLSTHARTSCTTCYNVPRFVDPSLWTVPAGSGATGSLTIWRQAKTLRGGFRTSQLVRRGSETSWVERLTSVPALPYFRATAHRRCLDLVGSLTKCGNRSMRPSIRSLSLSTRSSRSTLAGRIEPPSAVSLPLLHRGLTYESASKLTSRQLITIQDSPRWASSHDVTSLSKRHTRTSKLFQVFAISSKQR